MQQPACVTLTVLSGEATQVTAKHPDDATIRVSGEGKEILADGFEFGRETITFTNAGHYRIEITASGGTRAIAASQIDMSRTPVSLQKAAEWQAAEALAADSKHAPKVTTILASLEQWQALQDSSSIARTWLKLGDALTLLGDLSRAYDAYEHALEICRSIADTRCRAEAANNSGSSAQQIGDLADSLERLNEGAKAWQDLSLRLYQGKTLSNLGIVYAHIGEFQKAVSSYDRAPTILRPLDLLAYARVLNNLGLSYVALAEYGKAQIYFTKAIAIERSLQSAKADLIRARLNRGRTLMLQGRLHRARTLIEEIIEDTETQPDRTVRALALNNLGQTLFRLGLTNAAESRLQEALDLHQALGDKRAEANAAHYLGLIARTRGNVNAARGWLMKALEIRRTCGLRDDAADALYALADLEFTAGEMARAHSLAEEAISLLESIRGNVPGAELRASFYARRHNLLDLLVAITMRSDSKNAVTDGLIASEFGRSRSLLDILKDREQSSPKPPELINRQVKIRREIRFLSLMAADESGKHANVKPRLEALIADDEQVEARIRESLESRERGAAPLTSVSSLRQELSPHSAVLEYHLGERCSYVWLVRDRTIDVFTLPNRTVIESEISPAVTLFSRLQERLGSPAKQAQFLRAMRRLSRTLLGKLQPSVLPPLLILVLDGDLHRVPFAALRLPNGEYLGYNHDLVNTPSAAFLLQSSWQDKVVAFPKSILAAYDPVFSVDDPRLPPSSRKQFQSKGASLARLPFDDEIQTITRLVPRSRRDFLKGFDANVPALERLPLDQYAILYLSTHAIVDDQVPELSRIALSAMDRNGRHVDGFLFPYQLASLRLGHSTVVLSACETALGKPVIGEGLVGFASSLFSAGASQLVLTLSVVDAQASSTFFSETYRHLFASHPVSMEHALTLARRSLLESDKWADPYYWASFITFGVPTLHLPNTEASR